MEVICKEGRQLTGYGERKGEERKERDVIICGDI